MEHCTRKPGDEKEIPEFGRGSVLSLVEK